MTNIEKILTAEDICSILGACASNGVRVLKFAGLEVELGDARVLPRPEPTMASPYPATEIAEPNHVQQSRESLEWDELRLREQQIEDLLLSDPAEAERLLSEGELEDDGRDDQEDA